MSGSPIRSVLQELRLCGLVAIEPYRGTYVTRMNLDIINQIIYQRVAVETFVLTDFCNMCDELLLQKLQFLCGQMADSVKQDTFEASRFYQLDGQFHETWFAATHKRYLWDCIQRPDQHYTRFRMLDIIHFGNISYAQINQEHKELLQAIEARDADSFRPILERHLFGGFRRLGDLLLGELGDYFA